MNIGDPERIPKERAPRADHSHPPKGIIAACVGLRRSGLTWRAVAVILNNTGYLNSRGLPFTSEAIRRIFAKSDKPARQVRKRRKKVGVRETRRVIQRLVKHEP